MTTTLTIRVRAPFAAYRWLQAGVFRATAPIMTHSAAWGLVLNAAAVETRAEGDTAITGIRADAPALEIAIGAVGQPAERATLYQQLHSYPVGGSGKELKARTHGAKYWIAPVRRELLQNLDCVLGIRAEGPLAQRISAGLDGAHQGARYGLPFAGDNNLFLHEFAVTATPPPARWYVPVDERTQGYQHSARLTVHINRADSASTRTRLFAPSDPMSTPPEDAFVRVPPAHTS